MASITGTNGADWIYGQHGIDAIYGLGGNDLIKGGGGADFIDGGTGIDTVSYTDASNGVVIDLAAGRGYYDTAHGDTFAGIENVTGTMAGDDELYGDAQANVLTGLGGRDTLRGNGGADTLIGGDGNDDYYVDAYDTVIEAAGGGASDTVFTDTSYTLPANVEDLVAADVQSGATITLTGNALDNHIIANFGDNVLDGGGGNDVMLGLGGDDTYIVDSAYDTVTEIPDDGHDLVYSTVSYTLIGDLEDLSLATGTGVTGVGNALDNTLYGNALDNILNGGGGADVLSGLGGNDTFVFQAGEAQGDVVYEFEGNGAAAGDYLTFVGYGTPAEGATFVQVSPSEWTITSADGLVSETITVFGSLSESDLVFV